MMGCQYSTMWGTSVRILVPWAPVRHYRSLRGSSAEPVLNQIPKIGLPVDGDVYDPFLQAAAHRSTDTLRVLLGHCAARPHKSEILDERRFFLLPWACVHAQVDTVRFLLANESVFRHAYPWIGNIHKGMRPAAQRCSRPQNPFPRRGVWKSMITWVRRWHVANN
jgi:hypothetical protein